MRAPDVTTCTMVVRVVVAVLLVSCGTDEPAGPGAEGPRIPVGTPTDRHIVLMASPTIPDGFAEGVKTLAERVDQVAVQVEALGGQVMREHLKIGVVETSGLSDESARALASTPGVEGVDRDLRLRWIPEGEAPGRVMEGPSTAGDQSAAVFFRDFQWNMKQIAADAAWLTTAGGLGVRVAILDTGIDPDHIDLAGRIDLATSTSTLSASPCGPGDVETINDLNIHGSFVAGLVTSNGIGIASVAPDATLIAVKVLDCEGLGTFGDIIAGALHAASVGADVINMSLIAGFAKREARGLVGALQRTFAFIDRQGVLLVAAAGNAAIDLDRDRDVMIVPSQLASVMSIGATAPLDQMDFDRLATYTNFGVTGIDLMAPGGESGLVTPNIKDLVLSVCSQFVCGIPRAYVFGWGTSFAAPHAVGAAAVVASELSGDASPSRLRQCLVNGADDLGKPGTDSQYGHGRVNVVGASSC